MAVPDDTTLQPATPMTTTYTEGVRFYSLNPTAGQIVEFWNVPGAMDVYPATALYVGTSDVPRASYDILLLARAAGQELHFVTDYNQAWSADLSAQYLANLVSPVPLGAITAPVIRTGDVVSVAGTSMYFAFSVSASTLVYATANPGSGPLLPLVGLYDNTMELLAEPTPDFVLARVAPAAITEYILRVGDADYAGGATYSFDLTLSPLDGTTTAEGAEPNDTIAQAQAVATVPFIIAGNLLDDSDVDLYKFTLPAGMTTLTIQTLPGLGTPTTDTIVTLGTGTGTYINDNDDIDGSNSYYSRLVEAGLTGGSEYLLQVEGYEAGDYLLVVMAK